jgi:hypothetical protein
VRRMLFVAGQDVADFILILIQCVINKQHCAARKTKDGVNILLNQTIY